jgi:CheY-like chemotaxis protein
VAVEAGCLERNDAVAAMTISVSDTGIGIPENVLPTLSSKFRQADSSITRRFGGTGLGLAITKRLAEMMGGSVSVRSDPGNGSAFSLKLPLGIGQTGEFRQPENNGALKGVRVLVVDDHPINRADLAALCTAWGMRPDEAVSGEEAVRRACEVSAGDPYRIILLDRRMPGMDGLEALKRIRHTPRISDTPVILLCSQADRGERKDCGDAGCQGHLAKPVQASALLSTASAALGIATCPLVSPATQSRTGPDKAPAEDLAGRRVLLAEDNVVNQKLAATLLRKMGCRVDIAANGVEAVRLAGETRYDIILMDCQMPEMDGFQATREIREREHGKRRVPIIALTAHTMAGDREKCLAAGMDGYVSKPIQIPSLREALRIC